MRPLACFAVLLLTGCGAIAERNEPTQTDFFMVSKGSASMIYSIFVGGVDYCKVTKHGIQHSDFTGSIDYDGENCKVLIEADGK